MGKISSVMWKIGLVVFVVLAVAIYLLFVSKTLKDDNEYFQLTVAAKYNFKENTNAKSGESPDDLAVYDAKKSIYIYGNTYKQADDLKTWVDEDKTEFTKDATNISEVEKLEIGDFEAYTYSFEYVDSNDTSYYMEVTWIKTNNHVYGIDIECKSADKDKYKEEFSKIISTFKELN